MQILGSENGFYKVKVDGKTGYMMSKYITVAENSVSATLMNPNGNSIVNFRTAPGLNASIIKAHKVGTEITVLEMGDVWCKAEIDGVTGYVSKYFFKAVK